MAMRMRWLLAVGLQEGLAGRVPAAVLLADVPQKISSHPWLLIFWAMEIVSAGVTWEGAEGSPGSSGTCWGVEKGSEQAVRLAAQRRMIQRMVRRM